MKVIEKDTILFESLQLKLAAHDDCELWGAALSVLADEFAQRYAEESGRGVWAVVAGACSHWVRPHNSRWNAAGGFVYPDGYKDSVPELDWAAIFVFQDREWVSVEKLPGKKTKVFRVAIPSRTTRHRQISRKGSFQYQLGRLPRLPGSTDFFAESAGAIGTVRSVPFVDLPQLAT